MFSVCYTNETKRDGKKYEKEPLRAQIASDWWSIMDQWYSEAKQTQFLITFDTQLKIAPTAKIELND